MSPDILQTPYSLQNYKTLKNRIVMAPMTRASASDALVPTDAMVQYYTRRANSGLIITEGTVIRRDATGYRNVPGIYTPEQIVGWKRVTDSVHENEGLIFSQLWHVGRVSHPELLENKLPISSSETVMTGHVSRSPHLTYGKSRAASLNEIKRLISDYAIAASNAIKAGFDGIELHGANGYLIDQFLHYDTNHRQDDYGGSLENRARFALDVVKACGSAIGYERIGLRLSPGAYLNQIANDLRDGAVFQYLLAELSKLPIAYIHTGNFDDARVFAELDNKTMTDFMRLHYKGTLIACGSYQLEHAREKIAQGNFDLIAIGRPFIANHDLIQKLKHNQPLRAYEPTMLNNLY
jgi:N-ethylmaleimide reductase